MAYLAGVSNESINKDPTNEDEPMKDPMKGMDVENLIIKAREKNDPNG